MQSMLLAGFFEQYGIWIILVVLLLVMFVLNFLRSKKADSQAQELEQKLVPGTKVKTYSGFYGEIEKITETTDGKVVTLKIGENSYLDVDIRAIYGVDEKMTMAEYEKLQSENAENTTEKTETEVVEPEVVEPEVVESKDKTENKEN